MKLSSLLIIIFLGNNFYVHGQKLPTSINLKNINGGTFTMGSASLFGSPDQKAAAPEHQVTLSDFSISEAEITNLQYLQFLNEAYADGLIEINTGQNGPDKGNRLVQGTDSSDYSGKTLYNLDGIRVLKDHDNADGDNDPFTGGVEPENPLNLAYIDFDEGTNEFFIKDPFNADQCNWLKICDYQDYGSTKGQKEPGILNDFEDWAGQGQSLSDELTDWTEGNPEAATLLPNKELVESWPVTFVRWWGAWAFASYYGHSLPTEAQWEYAAKGGSDFQYAVYDGNTLSDANWNQDELKVATHHVRKAISGTANPFGLYNLAGNAWEWIADNYVAPYSTDDVTDPLIEEDGSTKRCWRGGSWNYHEATLQSAMRFMDEEDRGNDHFGFRIAGTNTGTGINNSTGNNNVKLYPNPATNFVTIGNIAEDVNYKVFSQSGQLITAGNGLHINTVDFITGCYFVRITSVDTVITIKLAIVK